MPKSPPTTDAPPPREPMRPALGLVVLALIAAAAIATLLLSSDEGRSTSGPSEVAATGTPPTRPGVGRTNGPFVPVDLPPVGGAVGEGLPEAQQGRARLTGRVVHADGTPPAAGRVVAWNGTAGLQAALGEQGAFTLERVGEGRWTLYAEADELREVTPLVVSVEGSDVDDLVLTLQGRSALDVTVRDGRTLATVGACSVRLEGRGSPLPCSTSGRVLVGPFASGAAVLVVEAAGYATRRVQVVFPTAGRVPLDILVSGGATITGLVQTSGKRPVEGATVTVARWSMAGGEEPAARSDPTATTDEKGRFTLSGLTPGRVAACAGATGFAQACGQEGYLPADGGRHDVVLVLGTGGAIAGRVVRTGGVGVAGASLQLTDLRARRSVGAAQGLEDGSFRFDAIAPGTYTVEAVSPSGRALANGVVVVDREETEVELLLGDDILRGTVTRADGKPAQGARVEARAGAAEGRFAGVVVGVDGRFELPGLIGAPYLVRASLEGAGSVEQRGVPAGAELSLVLGAAGSLAGEVRDSDGRPVTDFDVTLIPVAGSSTGPVSAGYRRTQVASPEGAFVERNLAAGQYTLRIETIFAPTATREVEVRGDEVTRVDVVLAAGLTVTGTTLVEGAPRAGCRISEIRRGTGRPSQPGRIVTTLEDGRFSVPGVVRGQTGVAANCGDGLVGVRWLDTNTEPVTDVVIELVKRRHANDAEEAPEFGGIGLGLGIDESGQSFVRFVSEGGPAFLAGIGRGDRLVAIDGWPVKGQSMDAIIGRVRGPVGTAVGLQLERESGQPYATVVERVRIVAGGP